MIGSEKEAKINKMNMTSYKNFLGSIINEAHTQVVLKYDVRNPKQGLGFAGTFNLLDRNNQEVTIPAKTLITKAVLYVGTALVTAATLNTVRPYIATVADIMAAQAEAALTTDALIAGAQDSAIANYLKVSTAVIPKILVAGAQQFNAGGIIWLVLDVINIPA